MKKHWFATCLCSAVLLLSEWQNVSVHAEFSGIRTGRFESYEQFENSASFGILMAADESLSAEVTETLPVSFDLRSRGLVSSVKNQKNYGMCWTFSAMNSLENKLISRRPEIDLSEWYLAYYAYSPKFGFPLALNTDMDDVFQQGGNYYMMLPMLTSWTGPVSEEVFPFDNQEVLNPDAEWEEVKAKTEYHVSSTEYFNYDVTDENFPAQLEAVKQAIYQGNALSISYYNKNQYYNSGKYAYCNIAGDKTGGTYHAVSVVGWDDNFSAENFSQPPEQDGAWLIKNSWGTDWGDNGYFWMSYYEPTILECYYLNTEPFAKHDEIYQHDDYGFWTAFSVNASDESAYIANVFTAEKDTYLTSAMLCTAMPEENYNLWVYTNPTKSSNPASGKVMASVTGMFENSGYHMIDLPEPVLLQEGDTFSIVAELSGTPGQHIPCEACTEINVRRDNQLISTETSRLTQEMMFRNFNQGESYYSSNGRTWYDVYKENPIEDNYTTEDGAEFSSSTIMGNVCIRGLTKDAGTVIFSEDADALPSGTEIVLSSPGSTEIYYSLDDRIYLPYTEPLVMPEQEMHISAYAVLDGEKQTVCEKSYTVQEAQISSLLAVRNQKEKEYLAFEKIGEQKYYVHLSPLAEGESFAVQPISTGEVTSGGEWLVSGKLKQIQPDETGLITLHVSQAGLLDTVYEIDFAQEEILLGDADNNGIVNAGDASAVLIYSAAVGSGEEPSLPDENWLLRADYNQDSAVNANDAAGILVYAAQQGV
ncbi:MAG: hypothetical protein IJJ69_05810 [Oscillospiraceae bacterium]|nr:hypothetical protein [Oscillospiraceae bacterium]